MKKISLNFSHKVTHGAHKKDNFSDIVCSVLDVFHSLKKNANKKYYKQKGHFTLNTGFTTIFRISGNKNCATLASSGT